MTNCLNLFGSFFLEFASNSRGMAANHPLENMCCFGRKAWLRLNFLKERKSKRKVLRTSDVTKSKDSLRIHKLSN